MWNEFRNTLAKEAHLGACQISMTERFCGNAARRRWLF